MSLWQPRLRAAGIHLGASATLGTLAALVVFLLWYPPPYAQLSGGRDLFLLMVAVDVTLGPLLTLVVFDRRKPASELRRDIGIIATFQLAFLAYGLWSMAAARPVHLVFEIDRLRVVHAADVPDELLAKAPPGMAAFPWTGPTLLSTRPFQSAEETRQVTLAAIQGLHIGARPHMWQPWEAGANAMVFAARPVSEFARRRPKLAPQLNEAVRQAGLDPEQALYLPVVARRTFWTALIEPKAARVAGFVPVDPFE